MVETVKKRVEWIDIAKGIAIILVLLGHSISSDNPLWQGIYSFHMPLFFILAGYTFRVKPTKEVLKTSALKLLVPYCVLFLLITLIDLLWQHGLTTEWLIPHLESFFFASAIHVKFFDLPQVGIIWFFWALFLGRVFLNAALTFCDKKNVPELARFIFFLVLSVAGGLISRVIFLPFALDLVCAVVFFIYLGYLLKQKGALLKTKINISGFFVCVVIWILCLIFTPYSTENFFSTRLYGSPLSAFTGSLVCIYVSMFIAEYIPVFKQYLLFMGSNSIIVLFIHAIGGNLIYWGAFDLISTMSHPQYAIFVVRTLFISLVMYLLLLNPLVRNKKS